ncbi:MAG: hypothetical protein WC378_14700 [Opitutaceae bacterium]|jgi:uncharacterized protein YaaW (UPF0174 family)
MKDASIQDFPFFSEQEIKLIVDQILENSATTEEHVQMLFKAIIEKSCQQMASYVVSDLLKRGILLTEGGIVDPTKAHDE